MITEDDTAKARNIAKRWRGNRRFDEDDAFQAAIENLIRRNPTEPGLRVRAMQEGISKQMTEQSFAVPISWSSYSRHRANNTLPAAVKDSGWTMDDLDLYGPVHRVESGYNRVTDMIWLEQTLDLLTDRQKEVVRSKITGSGPGREGRPIFWGRSERDVFQRAITALREVVDPEDGAIR